MPIFFLIPDTLCLIPWGFLESPTSATCERVKYKLVYNTFHGLIAGLPSTARSSLVELFAKENCTKWAVKCSRLLSCHRFNLLASWVICYSKFRVIQRKTLERRGLSQWEKGENYLSDTRSSSHLPCFSDPFAIIWYHFINKSLRFITNPSWNY